MEMENQKVAVPTTGTRKFLRGPTWTIGIQELSITQESKEKVTYLRNSDVEDALLAHPEYGRRVADGPVDL
jgi:hypothetical protein